MKKILLILIGFLSMFSPKMTTAQTPTFTRVAASDTVYFTVGGVAAINNNIINTTYAAGLVVKWHVIATNFPMDWQNGGSFGICDNNVCRYNTGDTAIWNNATHIGTTFVSSTFFPYALDTPGNFELSLDLSTADTLGSHFVTVAVKDTIANYTRNFTFIVNKVPTGVPVINNQVNDIILYPNPANDELNVVYDASADIKSIAVYNIIGKVLAVYKVAGTGANLTLENIPSGIYFVRLCNSNGNVVATRKFTKQ